MTEAAGTGRWIEGEGGLRRWSGPSWDDRAHGLATVHFSLDRPIRVTGALLENGTRADLETFSPFHEGVWRRPSDGRQILGRIEITEDDVSFREDAALNEAASTIDTDALRPMERDLVSDVEFMTSVEDVAFAGAVYESFCNRIWRRTGDGERQFVSWRTSGGFVATARRRGESYLDFYCSQIPGADARLPDVEEIYRRLGWVEIGEEEEAADRMEAMRRLKEIELRPEGDPRPDVLDLLQRFPGEGAYRRVALAYGTGRADESERNWIQDRL